MEKKDGKKKWGEDRKERLGVMREQGKDGRNRKPMREAVEGRENRKPMREAVESRGNRKAMGEAVKGRENRKPMREAVEDRGNRKAMGEAVEGRGNRKPMREAVEGRGNRKQMWEERERKGKGKEEAQAGKDKAGKKQEQGFAAGKRKADKNTEKNTGKKICHAFGDCGGCQLLGIPYAEQLAQKERELAKLLKPYVRLEGMIGMDQPEHYRNKVCAAFTHDREGNALSGVYKEGTHYIIPIEECLLENRKADEIIGSIRRLLPSFKIKTYNEDTGYGLLRHVMVRTAHITGEIMVVLVLASPILPSKNNFVKALLKLHPDITTIVVNVNDRKTSMVLGDKEQVVYGKGYIEDVLCGITFKISPKSFYQVNSVQTEKLYKQAIEYAGLTGSETVLDAYCGIGTIGMVAAAKAKRVIGVELNHDAVRDAVGNARKNKIRNIVFYEKDAGEFMGQLAGQGEKIDTVFMDPPRAGSDEAFLDALAELRPEKVVYISCNPETLVRDLGRLEKKGYHAVKGMGCDMFPFCGHVETIVLLSHKSPDSHINV